MGIWALFFCAITFVQANENEFVIGVEDISYYPLYDFSEKAPYKASFTKELLSTFFNSKGYAFRFVPLPLKRFDKWYIEDEIDFKFPDNIRWRSEQSKSWSISYSEPVVFLTAGAFVLAKNQNAARENFSNLGTILGFFPTLWYDRISQGKLKLIEDSSPYGLVKHLLRGNVDVLNIDPNVINYNLGLLGKENTEVVLNNQTKSESYAYHFSSVNYPEIIKEFNLFLRENPEVIINLKKKYSIVEAHPTN